MRWAEGALPTDRCLEEEGVGCRSFSSDAPADYRNNGRVTCVRRFLKLTHPLPYSSLYVGFGRSESVFPFSVSLVALFFNYVSLQSCSYYILLGVEPEKRLQGPGLKIRWGRLLFYCYVAREYRSPRRPEEGMRSPGSGVTTGGCEWRMWVPETRHVLLTTKLSTLWLLFCFLGS